jgi:hypothetical protein
LASSFSSGFGNWVHDSLCGMLVAQASSLLETQTVFDAPLAGKMLALRKLSCPRFSFSSNNH